MSLPFLSQSLAQGRNAEKHDGPPAFRADARCLAALGHLRPRDDAPPPTALVSFESRKTGQVCRGMWPNLQRWSVMKRAVAVVVAVGRLDRAQAIQGAVGPKGFVRQPRTASQIGPVSGAWLMPEALPNSIERS
jgi:hypothetical protein